MNKKTITGVIIVLVLAIGASGIWLVSSRDNSQNSNNSVNSQTPAPIGADVNSAEYKQYAEMTGEMYDRNFIANMIAHHEGAVDMAKLAMTNAKHQELKDMAQEIVTAQEKEIADMLKWQKDWGYPSSSGDNMMDHSAMGMMDDMAGMTAMLEGKTGDDFDRTYIEQMILHHQSAINMAAPGKTNAQRQELKDLTVAIVDAQSREIALMKQWQQDWGYATGSSNER